MTSPTAPAFGRRCDVVSKKKQLLAALALVLFSAYAAWKLARAAWWWPDSELVRIAIANARDTGLPPDSAASVRESVREGVAFPVLLTLAAFYWLWKLLRKAAGKPERDR
jgi:hypothetical protein